MFPMVIIKPRMIKPIEQVVQVILTKRIKQAIICMRLPITHIKQVLIK